MPANPPAQRWFERRTARWTFVLLIWTLLALLSACQSALLRMSLDEPVEWGRLLPARLADWYTCAVFTPAYFWLVRRYPIDRQHWVQSLPIHLVTTSIFVVLKYALYVPILNWLASSERVWRLSEVLARSFILESIAFWCLLGVVHAIEFYRRYREREVTAARLQAQLSAAQLEALSAQLQPHFLFNTLHSISTLMHRDVEAADTMLSRLSDLLRRTTQHGQHQQVALSEELQVLGLYVAIMQARFQDRLVVDTHVSPEASQALVPHFVLQPLVENALQHGIAHRAGAGRIEIRAERVDHVLRIAVTDDGVGMSGSDGALPREGIGLSNTRRRLEQLYGAAQWLELQTGPDGGLRVSLVIPYRTL